jgi:hypothetical protein
VHRVISTTPAARQCAIGEHHESEASVNLQLAHPNPAYGKVSLIEPAPLGYLHIGAEVRPLVGPPRRRYGASRQTAHEHRTNIRCRD